mgnify:CR=1 FL=1
MTSEIEVMIQEIRRRGEEEAGKIIEEAKARAEKIIEEAKRKADVYIENMAKQEIITMRRRILGSAGLEGHRKVLMAKEKVISAVMEMASERLRRIVEGKDPEVDYRKVLHRLISEAVKAVGEPEVYVYANESDSRYIRRRLRAISKMVSEELEYKVKIRLAKQPIDCIGGVVVSNPDGTKTYYNTLDGKLNDAVRRFRSVLGRTLFKRVVEA